MKKIFFALILICGLVAAQNWPDGNVFSILNTGVTNMAASATSTTLAPLPYSLGGQSRGFTIYMSAQTYTNVGNVTAYFSLSPDGTTYSTPLNSAVKLTMNLTNSVNATGVSTNTVEDWFYPAGISRMRLARVENNSPTSVSNLSFIICYPVDSNTQNR